MKNIILILKTELSDKKILIFNMFMIFIIISCIIGFFGTIYGRQYQAFYNRNFTINGYVTNYDQSLLSIMEKYDSESSYFLSSNINEEKYQDFTLVFTPSNYDFNGDITGQIDQSSNNNIVIPYALAVRDQVKIGDKIKVFSTEYIVTGTSGMLFNNSAFIVSYEEFIKNANTITFDAIINKGISQERYMEIVSSISAYLNPEFHYSQFDKDTEGYLKEYRMYAIALFAAAIINVVYIYSYVMNKRKQRMVSYRLVGASNKWLYSFIAIDVFIVFTFCYILAVSITSLFYNNILVPNIPNTEFLLSTKDVLTFYIYMLAIYSIILAFYIWRIGRYTISELNHKEGF